MEIEVKDSEVLEILKEEIRAALKNSKNGKALGPDQIPIVALKCMNDDTLNILLDLFNTVFKIENIPRQWLLSIFCAIPKTTIAKDCNENRTIPLISVFVSIFFENIFFSLVYGIRLQSFCHTLNEIFYMEILTFDKTCICIMKIKTYPK